MNLAAMYRTFHPNSGQTLYLAALKKFSKIEHILGHKANLYKFKMNEIIPHVLSDYNAIQLKLTGEKSLVNIQS